MKLTSLEWNRILAAAEMYWMAERERAREVVEDGRFGEGKKQWAAKRVTECGRMVERCRELGAERCRVIAVER